MKHITRLILIVFLAVLISLTLPTAVQAKDAADDKVVFGDTYHLGSGQTQDGDLAILGGSATLDADSRVNGDVVLMGGTLDINGTVSGNVSMLGGTLFLGDTAVVQGDVTMMGGTLHRSENARINGSLINNQFRPFQFTFPNWPTNLRWLDGIYFTPFRDFFAGLFSTLVMAALAMLVVLLWPRPVERVAQSIASQPALTGGLGLLTVIVLPAMLIMLAVTLIMIPLSLLGFLVLGIAFIFGWIGLGLEVGNRIAGLFKQQWNPALVAGLGTLVIGLLANSVGRIPCIGWMITLVAALIGLGAVVVTRFGTQIYPANPVPVYAVTPTTPPANPPASGEGQTPAM